MLGTLLGAGVKVVEETNKNVCCHRVYVLLATDKTLNWLSLDQMPLFSTIVCGWQWREAGSRGRKCGHLVTQN